MITNIFVYWGIFNLFVGIWEIYAFANRDKLVLIPETIWNKIKNGSTTIKTFWLDAWIEYCKVDSRYIKKYSPTEYVWNFELLNALIAFIFIICIANANANANAKVIKMLLLISIINCSCYFLTLIIEIYKNKIILENIKKYASTRMIILYYLICSIWLIVPISLYLKL